MDNLFAGSEYMRTRMPQSDSRETRKIRNYVPKAPIKIGKEKWMKDPYDEGLANRNGPESCVGTFEGAAKR